MAAGFCCHGLHARLHCSAFLALAAVVGFCEERPAAVEPVEAICSVQIIEIQDRARRLWL